MAARELYTVDVPFVSGTKKIAYTANALASAEKELGCKVLALLSGEGALQRLGFTEVRALLWAGLRAVRARGGPEWSIDRVGDEMDLRHLADYVVAIVRAVNLALSGEQEPKPPAGDPDPTTETVPKSSTGTVSE